jgi:hypothetical protein
MGARIAYPFLRIESQILGTASAHESARPARRSHRTGAEETSDDATASPPPVSPR